MVIFYAALLIFVALMFFVLVFYALPQTDRRRQEPLTLPIEVALRRATYRDRGTPVPLQRLVR
jgi:hypothetical protein